MNEDKFQTIETNRLILRKITDDDALMLYENVFNNFEWFKFYYQIPFKDLEDYQNLVQKFKDWYQNGNHFRWGIVEKKSNIMIGSVQIHTKDLFNNSCKLACIVGYNYAHQGYAKEALKAVIDFAFNVLKFHRLEANIVTENVNSIKLVKSLGMEFEAIKKDGYKIGDKYYDQDVYILINKN